MENYFLWQVFDELINHTYYFIYIGTLKSQADIKYTSD